MNKRIIAAAMILVLLVIAVPLGYAQENSLFDISMEMISNVHTLAGDEYLFTFYIASGHTEYLPAIAESDCTDFRSAYSIKMPLLGLIFLVSDYFLFSDYSKLSKPGMAKATQAVMGYGNHWNSTKGAQAITECAVTTWTYSYAKPEGFTECSWLVDCGGKAYCIAFYNSGENIITASAMPVFLGEDETIETVVEYFKQQSPLMVFTQEYPASQK